MAVTPLAMARTTLGTSSATLGTAVPGSRFWIITSIVVCNKTAVDQTFTLAFDGVEVFKDQPLPAKATGIFDVRQFLGAGKTITGLASAGTSITVHISGTETV